jgi:hypothetical protein
LASDLERRCGLLILPLELEKGSDKQELVNIF